MHENSTLSATHTATRRAFRYPLAALVLILLISAALRMPGIATNSLAVLADDPLDYHTIARSLLSGAGYQQVEGFAYGRQPGWPLLLAGAYALGGPAPQVGAWATALLGVLSVAVTYRIGQRVCARPAGGLMAAAVVAVDPFLIVQDQTLLSESLYTLVGLLTVWALLGPKRDVRGATGGAWVGALFAAAILIRSNGFGLLAGLVGARVPLRAAAVALIVCGALLLPWAIRNQAVGAGFSPFAPQTGQLLLGSYNTLTRDNREAYGLWLYPKEIPEGAPYAGLPYLQREAAWADQAWAFIRANVAALPAMMLRRVARFGGQLVAIPREGLPDWVIAWQPIFYALLLSGALAGAILMLRRSKSGYLRLVLWLLAPALALAALLYGEARFRAPFDPLLACLLAWFCVALIRPPRRHRPGPIPVLPAITL